MTHFLMYINSSEISRYWFVLKQEYTSRNMSIALIGKFLACQQYACITFLFYHLRIFSNNVQKFPYTHHVNNF